jgi:hypothetical protein
MKKLIILLFATSVCFTSCYEDEGIDIWDALQEIADTEIKFTGWTDYEYTDYTFFNPPEWIQGFWFVENYNGIQFDEFLNPSMDDFNLTFTSHNVLIFDGDLNRHLNRVNGTYKLIEETITTTSYKIVIEWTRPYIIPKRQILQLTYVSETEILFRWDKGFIDKWDDRERSEEGTLYSIKDADENHMTYVPDDNFEQALIALGHDDVLNDSILTNNIIGVKKLNLESAGISDLTGIEAFTLLTKLNCKFNQLTHLDLSQNKHLGELDCSLNELIHLNVSKNINLKELRCSHNELTTLDINQNTALIDLWVSNNQLTSLNISKNIELEYLGCMDNQLTSLDISKNEKLTKVDCGNNPLTCIKVNQNQLDPPPYILYSSIFSITDCN